MLFDYCTQGDWIGRYGKDAWILCGAASPWDYTFQASVVDGYELAGTEGDHIQYRVYIGENCRPGDRLRNWIHWYQTEDPRALLNPVNGGRRQAEWDDHGETYPWEHKGPHTYLTFALPKTQNPWWLVSFYFVNKDGHWGANRYRDYLLWIKEGHSEDGQAGGWEKNYDARVVVARARVHDFWNGVYVRFLLPAGSLYTVKIDKNSSFNTICSGVFYDQVQAIPDYFLTLGARENLPASPEELGHSKIRSVPLLLQKWRSEGIPAYFAAARVRLTPWIGQMEKLLTSKLDGVSLRVLALLYHEAGLYVERDESLERERALWGVRSEMVISRGPMVDEGRKLLSGVRKALHEWERIRWVSEEMRLELFLQYLAMATKHMPKEETLTLFRFLGRQYALIRPAYAEAAYEALSKAMVPESKDLDFSYFTDTDLYGLAQSYRQQQFHSRAARVYQYLLERYPSSQGYGH